MMDGETMRFIREEIKKQVNIVLAGLSGNNDQFTEDINSQYPGSPVVTGRPIMHPYGLVSRAPQGTTQVIARVGDHPGNRMVLGHRDVKRPSLNSGEVQLYNQFGQAIYLQEGKVHVGSQSSSDPIPLGNELQAMLSIVLDAIATHTHLGNLGYPTGVPQNATVFEEQKASPVDDKKMLSDKVFTEK